jgi:hypothetical protein
MNEMGQLKSYLHLFVHRNGEHDDQGESCIIGVSWRMEVDVYFFPKMPSSVTEMHVHVTPYFGLCSKLQGNS